MLELRRLALLRELAARGTVTATAEAMRLTGPAVSQQLAVLEREAGIALLEKQGRRLALTPAGQLLVAHADLILAGVATAESDLAALRGGALGTIRIAAFPSVARAIVAGLWQHKELDLRLVEQEPERSVGALLNREIDLAVVHAYSLLPRDLPGCDTTALLDDPVLLALHPAEAAAHGLAPGDGARLADFAGMDWLVPGPETSCHEMVQRACGASGFVVRAVAHATDFSVLAAMVAAGAGAALMPRMALPAHLPEISLHPLTEPVTRSISVLARSGEGHRPELRRTVEALQEATAQYLAQP